MCKGTEVCCSMAEFREVNPDDQSIVWREGEQRERSTEIRSSGKGYKTQDVLSNRVKATRPGSPSQVGSAYQQRSPRWPHATTRKMEELENGSMRQIFL